MPPVIVNRCIALFSVFLLASNPAFGAVLEDGVFHTCFPIPEPIRPLISSADCYSLIQGFVTAHYLPHYTFLKERPREPAVDVIVPPYVRTGGTCSLEIKKTNRIAEQYETRYIVRRMMEIVKDCTKPGKIGGRSKLGAGLSVAFLQFYPRTEGRLGGVLSGGVGEMANGTILSQGVEGVTPETLFR